MFEDARIIDLTMLSTFENKWRTRCAYSETLMRYLTHVCLEIGIRRIAEQDLIAPSTVSRQCQKVEAKRDDVFFDQMIAGIECEVASAKYKNSLKSKKDIVHMIHERQSKRVSDAKLELEARRILRRLCEKGAFLLLSSELDNAAIFKEHVDGSLQRLSVLGRAVAEEFLLRDWVEGKSDQRVGRYEISTRGRAALKRLLHRAEALKNAEGEFDQQPAFAGQHAEYVDKSIYEDGKSRRFRVNVAESPLAILARKKNKVGEPYLTSRQVAAGERLREDFEVAQIGPRVTQNWDRFLAAATRGQFHEMNGASPGAEEAKVRLNKALTELGDGLADIAFRCCCYLEGLESLEGKFGWSARSGKVVLKIALERLADFYSIPERKSGR